MDEPDTVHFFVHRRTWLLLMRNDLTLKYRPMDNPVQDYVFLDLSGLGEDDLSHLRSVLGANPEEQGLSLPWAEEEVSVAEPPLEPDDPESNDGCNWLSPREHPDIQFAVATLPPPPHAYLPPQFFSGGSPTCQWLQAVPTGGAINGGLLDDVDLGDESIQPTDDGQVAVVLPPPDVGGAVVPSAGAPLAPHDMMHSPYSPHDDQQHAMYSTVYQHMYQPMPYPHQPVAAYPMMDPPHPRDQQQRRQTRKPSGKHGMHSMHGAHGQDMVPRAHFEGYQYTQYHQYATPYQTYPMPNVHHAAGSPIIMYHHPMYEGMYPVALPPPAGPKMAFSQAPPVSGPAPAVAAACPPVSLSAPPLLPAMIPVSVPGPLLPEPLPPPAPAPAPVLAPAPPAQAAGPPSAAPAPRPSGPSGPMTGPPAGAVMSAKKPAVVAPKTELAGPAGPTGPVVQAEEKLPTASPPGSTSPQAVATTDGQASNSPPPQPQMPSSEGAAIPAPALAPHALAPLAPAVPTSEPAKSPTPEPAPAMPASIPPPAPVKLEDSQTTPAAQSTGPQWGGKASFASLFNNKASSSAPSGYPSSVTTTIPNHAFNNQRNDGPQAVPPPTQSGWGPMQPPNKSVHNAQQSRNYPQTGVVPSGVAPPLPLPNPSQDPKLYHLSEWLHSYKLEHKPTSLQPRGLTNRNNWCYINSTLQALLACPPFYNLFSNLPDLPSSRSSDSRAAVLESMKMFVKEFKQLAPQTRVKRPARSKEGESVPCEIQTGTPFEPTCVYRMLSVIQTDNMVEGRQEDAEEFLSCLLNSLNDEMLDLMKITGELSNGDISATVSPIPPPSNGETELLSQDEADEWKVMGPKNKGAVTRKADFGRTPLSDIFRGQLRSRVFRSGQTNDNTYTDNVQPFFTLQLDIENSTSVKDALEAYMKRDKLEGLTCSRSNQEVAAWQEVQLEELPPVLLLHLKWFDYSHEGCSKILKSIRYDIELKIDTKLLSSKKQKASNQQQYQLFAVVYHDGKEATKGHYITDAFHMGYNQWIRYDDSTVKPTPVHYVLNPRPPRVPYLLYYRRNDTV